MTSGNNPFTLLVTAASDPALDCERVVRAALVVAKAIGDMDFATWCEAELTGYFTRKVSDLPDYRWVNGVVMVKDEWGRVAPGMFQSAKDQERVARSHIAEPLGQVEKNAKSAPGSEFYVQFPPEMGAHLREAFHAVDVFRVVQRLSFENVVTHVRQTTFMWAVGGINRDVPGHLSATVAALLGIAHLAPFHQAPSPVQADLISGSTFNLFQSNVLLNSAGATVSVQHHQGVDQAALVKLVSELRLAVEALAKPDRPGSLVDALGELEGLAAMPTPRSSFVREALGSLRTVLEGGAGTVLGELAKPHILALMANVLK